MRIDQLSYGWSRRAFMEDDRQVKGWELAQAVEQEALAYGRALRLVIRARQNALSKTKVWRWGKVMSNRPGTELETFGIPIGRDAQQLRDEMRSIVEPHIPARSQQEPYVLAILDGDPYGFLAVRIAEHLQVDNRQLSESAVDGARENLDNIRPMAAGENPIPIIVSIAAAVGVILTLVPKEAFKYWVNEDAYTNFVGHVSVITLILIAFVGVIGAFSFSRFVDRDLINRVGSAILLRFKDEYIHQRDISS
jgi:hypothetical protein